MGKQQRIVTTVLWAALVLVMVGVVVGQFWRPRRDKNDIVDLQMPVPAHGNDLPDLFPAARFSLTDQNGKLLNSSDLAGHPWVASFIFTSCADICPIMAAQLAEVQQQTPGALHLVSFSVDPLHDTPPVLKQYAAAHHADDSRWHFLTGTEKQIFDVAQEMKVSAIPAGADHAVQHSGKFLLVDGAGEVRGIYEGQDPADVKKLISDGAALASRKGPSL